MSYIKNFGYMIKLTWQINKRSFLQAFLQIVFDSVEPFISLIFPTLIINELSTDKDWNKVLLYIAFFVGTIILINTLRIIFSVFMSMSVNRADTFFSFHFSKLFTKLSNLFVSIS